MANSVLDLVPIPNSGKINGDVKELTRHIQSIHEQVHQRIEASNAKYKEAADRHRRPLVFNEGDMVWAYLRRERLA